MRRKPAGERRGGQPAAAEPLALDARVVERVEAHLGLVARWGLGPPRIMRDRAEVLISWRSEAFEITLSFAGLDELRSLGVGLVPPQRSDAFSLHQAVEVLDPRLHARYPAPVPVMDEAAFITWLELHARFFETHAQVLLERPTEVLDRIKRLEPLGEQCVRLVAMCREILRLEADHGFGPPTAIHWRHDCTIEFRRGPCRVIVRLEDHEKGGVVVEPFTVPELYVRAGDDEPELSLTTTAERIDPDHAARRPVAAGYAMALSALLPWLEHDAAFLRMHPEVLGGSSP